MKKQEESRRAFLIGSAVGASAVAGAGLVPNALAQTHEQHNAADVPATTALAPTAVPIRNARRDSSCFFMWSPPCVLNWSCS